MALQIRMVLPFILIWNTLRSCFSRFQRCNFVLVHIWLHLPILWNSSTFRSSSLDNDPVMSGCLPYPVTADNRRQLENLPASIAGSGAPKWSKTLGSISSSVESDFCGSVGQFSSACAKNSGPFNHLLIAYSTRGRPSILVFRLHLIRRKHSSALLQHRTFRQSVQYEHLELFTVRLLITFVAYLHPRTAACSSNRGMEAYFKGATRVFPAISEHST